MFLYSKHNKLWQGLLKVLLDFVKSKPASHPFRYLILKCSALVMNVSVYHWKVKTMRGYEEQFLENSCCLQTLSIGNLTVDMHLFIIIKILHISVKGWVQNK